MSKHKHRQHGYVSILLAFVTSDKTLCQYCLPSAKEILKQLSSGKFNIL
jgi:hypothetical protein